MIPDTPVVAVDTRVRLEAESYFTIHDSDRPGTLDLYQMVLALQAAGCASQPPPASALPAAQAALRRRNGRGG